MSSIQGFMCEVCYSYHIGSDIFPSRFFLSKADAETFMQIHSSDPRYGVDIVECELHFSHVDGGKQVFVERIALSLAVPSLELHTGSSDSRMEVWVTGNIDALVNDPTTHTGRRWARSRAAREPKPKEDDK